MLTRPTIALLATLLTAFAQPARAENATSGLRLVGIVPPSVSVVTASRLFEMRDGQVAIKITERSNSAKGYKLLLVDQQGGHRLLSVTYEAHKARSSRLFLPKVPFRDGAAPVVTLIVRGN